MDALTFTDEVDDIVARCRSGNASKDEVRESMEDVLERYCVNDVAAKRAARDFVLCLLETWPLWRD